jgi:hypothetical protein
MSISPATRFVFALAVGLLSAAPVAARANEAAAPLVWALASAEMAPTPGEGPDAGPGGLAPVVAASTCNAEINGDNITDFSSVDAQALRDALAAVAANGLVATFDPSVKAHREFPVQYPNSAYAYVPGKAFGDYAAEQIANAVEHGEAAIVAHVKGVAKGAVDADNVTSLSTARIGDRRVAGTVF